MTIDVLAMAIPLLVAGGVGTLVVGTLARRRALALWGAAVLVVAAVAAVSWTVTQPDAATRSETWVITIGDGD